MCFNVLLGFPEVSKSTYQDPLAIMLELIYFMLITGNISHCYQKVIRFNYKEEGQHAHLMEKSRISFFSEPVSRRLVFLSGFSALLIIPFHLFLTSDIFFHPSWGPKLDGVSTLQCKQTNRSQQLSRTQQLS